MNAIVVTHAGGPEQLEIQERPVPVPGSGDVLIRVRAFGLNRSELHTRSNPALESIVFPRILGIECVGEVVDAAGDDELRPGQTVIAVMAGMGKDIDGGYAELVSVPSRAVIPVETSLSWPELAALPMAYGTAWGSIVDSLGVLPGEHLLIRGGSSSVGMAALVIAKALGATVVATTRNEGKVRSLRAGGADHVVIDAGHNVGSEIRDFLGGGADCALELIGPPAAVESASALEQHGTICVTGFLAESWSFDGLAERLHPVRLARFKSGVMTRPTYGSIMQRIVERVERGVFSPNIHRVFEFKEISEAHRIMERNEACGKLVVVVP